METLGNAAYYAGLTALSSLYGDVDPGFFISKADAQFANNLASGLSSEYAKVKPLIDYGKSWLPSLKDVPWKRLSLPFYARRLYRNPVRGSGQYRDQASWLWPFDWYPGFSLGRSKVPGRPSIMQALAALRPAFGGRIRNRGSLKRKRYRSSRRYISRYKRSAVRRRYRYYKRRRYY